MISWHWISRKVGKNVQKKYFPDFYRTRCECTQEFKKIYENSAIDFLITFECKSMQVKVIVEMKISRVNNASWIIYFSNNFLKDSCSKTLIPEMLVHFLHCCNIFPVNVPFPSIQLRHIRDDNKYHRLSCFPNICIRNTFSPPTPHTPSRYSIIQYLRWIIHGLERQTENVDFI